LKTKLEKELKATSTCQRKKMHADDFQKLLGCELKEMKSAISLFEPWEIKSYPAAGGRSACR
jgi:hypothetical protein